MEGFPLLENFPLSEGFPLLENFPLLEGFPPSETFPPSGRMKSRTPAMALLPTAGARYTLAISGSWFRFPPRKSCDHWEGLTEDLRLAERDRLSCPLAPGTSVVSSDLTTCTAQSNLRRAAFRRYAAGKLHSRKPVSRTRREYAIANHARQRAKTESFCE